MSSRRRRRRGSPFYRHSRCRFPSGTSFRCCSSAIVRLHFQCFCSLAFRVMTGRSLSGSFRYERGTRRSGSGAWIKFFTTRIEWFLGGSRFFGVALPSKGQLCFLYCRPVSTTSCRSHDPKRPFPLGGQVCRLMAGFIAATKDLAECLSAVPLPLYVHG